ncbi:hypothetical protein DPMN_073397 [Dreissena polymorpha]|uniref:protein-tyrosine-phosphatase n=2 Tax=Dreissena polymorpha TaxID=45954 RepID=A0A9D4BYZ8_DREPO|nr:hypothetical protein DPMN_073397 [Dreissena polymorpha]
MACDKLNGTCFGGCRPGFDFNKSATCNVECDNGTYGTNCSKECSQHCSPQLSCDKSNGACFGHCRPGFNFTRDVTCNIECENGTFGDNCVEICSTNCQNPKLCNKTDGTCIIGCRAGYDFKKNATCHQECDDGQYGFNCTNLCPNCFGTCNKTDGACLGGCIPGYDFKRNKTCTEACTTGYYGSLCNSTCHCQDVKTCDPISGICSNGMCAPGWKLDNCSTECEKGHYGLNCSQTCDNHCSDPLSCDKADGTCFEGCISGYDFQTNSTCNVECAVGKFGLNCNQTCSEHCSEHNSCNKTDGYCIGGCTPGYDFLKNASCNRECANGNFGLNCSNVCSKNCEDSSFCNKSNGYCFGGCRAGYDFESDPTCNKECDDGKFGINCSYPCSYHCLESRPCNKTDGVCIGGCSPGYNFKPDQQCNLECENGKYGKNCATDCNCNYCHHVNGSCTVFANSCFTGFTLGLADICTSCNPGLYGDNCSMECHCDRCDNVNGSCALLSFVCHDGFHFEQGLCKADDVDSSSSAAVGGGVGAAVGVIVAIAVVVIVLRRRHMLKRNTEQHDTAEMTDISKTLRTSTGHDNFAYSDAAGHKIYENPDIDDYYSFKSVVPGIKVHLLWDYIREKTKHGSSYFADEFSKLSKGLIYKHDVASLPENRGKNRYREMFAYDHSRVPLTKDKSTDSEYINACFIHGFEKVKKFIASQGPTEKMIDDFWRMIWQQRVEKIAMLTNLIELGTLKCLQYWPEELNGVSTFGDVSVKYIGVKETYDYIIRTFNINKGKETRLVKQFHLKTWPDKDVPDTTWCLLDFWRAVDTNVSSNTSPIVVHCSAGVGRTGTFIALDNLIIQGRMECSVRPFPMVEALRQQRVSMVQTKEQYVYLHEALAEALLIGTHHTLTRQFEDIYQYIIGTEKGSNSSRMDEQFDLIMRSVEDSAIEVYPTASSEPMYGNVETAMLEIDAYRPQLMKRGSKFIQQLGTMLLPTIGNTNALLVCMSPTDQHLEEFWSLVEEQHVTTVISLAAHGSEPYETCQYLGARGSGRVGQFSVNYIHEKKNKGSVERTFSFRDENHEDEDYMTTIKQFQLTSWLEGHDTPSDMQSFLDLLEEVLKWQPHLSDKRPIMIHCQTGFMRCGPTALVLNEIQRIKKENGQINIVESVKTMKTRCRDLIQNKTQYRFCYEAILTYIKNYGTYQNL